MGIRSSFLGSKAAWPCGWPITSNLCQGQENVDLYINFPLHLHSLMLNYLSTGTTQTISFKQKESTNYHQS
jgi:hypothetical protein